MGVTIYPPNVDADHQMCIILMEVYLDRDKFKLRYVHLQACYSEQVFKLVQTEQRKTGQIRIQGGLLSQPGHIDDRRKQED